MKQLLLLLVCCISLPVCAFHKTALERVILSAPIDEPIWSIYSGNISLNSRRAVRLGYTNFHTRINTPNATLVDAQIALFITTRLQPFFNKISNAADQPNFQQSDAQKQYQEEFNELVNDLTSLLRKNQTRYTNPTFLNQTSAIQETLLIIEEALEKGSF
ncbi:MAG: hypothetical protein J6Q05_06415 [Elusimicrobiaceae bacterium]|nr:hypothetical protein [Elusimicrobiaceae bacterium]